MSGSLSYATRATRSVNRGFELRFVQMCRRNASKWSEVAATWDDESVGQKNAGSTTSPSAPMMANIALVLREMDCQESSGVLGIGLAYRKEVNW